MVAITAIKRTAHDELKVVLVVLEHTKSVWINSMNSIDFDQTNILRGNPNYAIYDSRMLALLANVVPNAFNLTATIASFPTKNLPP